jgi:hypothetical protein
LLTKEFALMPGKIDEFGPETIRRIEATAIRIASQMGIPIDFAKATAVTDELTRRRVQKIADDYDRLHGKPKMDGWKFLRNVAAKVVGDIDNFTK